jgi:hypothetical protein
MGLWMKVLVLSSVAIYYVMRMTAMIAKGGFGTVRVSRKWQLWALGEKRDDCQANPDNIVM